ncbi:MAG: neutral/alkaline non-lysosomal ceramidase N-terminal domain-containing protein [Candidatus Hydrogenedentes bacterium]|nr:neutral/alkaline non-lysosomal ceramidase N-terminal domain-containing protein [Candidatus Hydrogenedentota bacterium]
MAKNESRALRVGFAVRCITPPVGKEIPGLLERRFATGTNDDLFARAVVLSDGPRRVALVQVDSLVVPTSVVAAARKAARHHCGVCGQNCLIAATHTHSGGPIFDGFLSEHDPDYESFLASQIALAISEADADSRPAQAGIATSRAEGVAFNRRFIMKDGSQRTHPGKLHPDIVRSAGPADPTVTVVGFRDPQCNEPFGCIVNFACHATHMNGLRYSADYPRWIVDTLQRVHGPDFGVVFLNGACADVTQVDNLSDRPVELGPYWCARTGRAAGAAALQALAVMPYRKKTALGSTSANVMVGVRRNSAAAIAEARRIVAKNTADSPNPETIFARELLHVERFRKTAPKVNLEIQTLHIGDALFWSVPGELFQALALEVRDLSPFPYTCCVELANGYAGYICTRDAYSGGGYEVRPARSSFLAEDTGKRMVKAARTLIKKLPKPNAASNLLWDSAHESGSDDANLFQLSAKRKK